MTSPPPPIEQDIAKVAGSLTKAQRACVLAMGDLYQYARDIPAAGSTLRSLWDFQRDYSTTDGCVAAPVMIVTQDVSDYPLGHVWALSSLGLAVRQYLQDQTT